MFSLTPAPPSDLDSCTLTWEESLSHWLPPSPPSLDTRAWPGGWRWQQVLLLSWQPHPSSHPEFPGSRTTERHLWAVPHWPSLGLRSPAPGPHPYPGPRPHPATLDWARPCLPRTTGASLGVLGCTVRGASWTSPRHPRIVSAPWAVSATPTGATSPAACPLLPVTLPCVVSRLLPQGLGWLNLPSHLLTPWGVSLPIFECDFKVKK